MLFCFFFPTANNRPPARSAPVSACARRNHVRDAVPCRRVFRLPLPGRFSVCPYVGPSPVSPRGGRPAGAGADSFTLDTFSAALLDCYSEYSYEHSLVRLSLVVGVATRKTRQRRRSGRVAVVACEAGQGPQQQQCPCCYCEGEQRGTAAAALSRRAWTGAAPA